MIQDNNNSSPELSVLLRKKCLQNSQSQVAGHLAAEDCKMWCNHPRSLQTVAPLLMYVRRFRFLV